MAFRWLFFFFLPLLVYAQEGYRLPWGKDSALASLERKEKPKKISSPPSPLAQVAQGAIAFHQNVLTHADGPRSHFRPTSSRYAQLAIERYGFIRGFLMGCDRLLRENSDPWVYRKILIDDKLFLWDPVP